MEPPMSALTVPPLYAPQRSELEAVTGTSASRIVVGFQTQYFPPDPASNAILYASLVDHLGALLRRVDVVTARPHYGEHTCQLPDPPVADTVRVVRCRAPRWRRHHSLPARFASEVSFSARNAVAALRASGEWDVVLASTPPLVLGLGSAVVARARKIPLVWWVQDLHPEIATALDLASGDGLAFRVLHRAHDWILRGARTVVAISAAQRQTLLEAYPSLCPDRVVVLENPAAHGHATELGEPPCEEQLLVSYTGNLGRSQGLEHVLDVAASVRHLPVRFALHGNGAAEVSLRNATSERKLHNVEFSGFGTDEEYLDLLRRTHVLMLVLRPGIDRYSFPSKLWTYLAAGRPIIGWAGRGGAVEQTLQESGAGVFAPWGDVPASVAAIAKLVDGERRSELAAAARTYYRSHPTPAGHARQLADVLDAAIGARR
jgi:colanic acid biosynthesis glycosyl transferase WcaI